MLGRPLTIAELNLPVLGILPASVSFPVRWHGAVDPGHRTPAVALRGRADDRRFRLLARVKPGATPEQVSEDTARRPCAGSLRRLPIGTSSSPVPVETIQDHLYGGVRPLLAAFFAGAAPGTRRRRRERRDAAARTRGDARKRDCGAARTRSRPGPDSRRTLHRGSAVVVRGLCLRRRPSLLAQPGDEGQPDGHTPETRCSRRSIGRCSVSRSSSGLLVALGCTIGPGLHALRTNVAPLLRSFGAPGLRLRRRMTASLVVAQIALSTVLLVSGALLVRSVVHLLAVDLGVTTGNAVTMKVMLSDTMQLVQDRAAFVESFLDQVRALPGCSASRDRRRASTQSRGRPDDDSRRGRCARRDGPHAPHPGFARIPRRAWCTRRLRTSAGGTGPDERSTGSRDQPIGGARAVCRSSAGRSGFGGDNPWERKHAPARRSASSRMFTTTGSTPSRAAQSIFRGIGCRSASCRSWFGRPVRRCNPSRRSAGFCSGWIPPSLWRTW